MLTIGITGGIGSGKSTVCKIFETLGIPVYYADDAAKRLMHEDPELVTAIRKTFGEDIYDPSGVLQRTVLANQVFNNPEALAKLNGLVHPAVAKDVTNWVARQQAPYVIKEAALLYETGSYKELDKIIVVTAPEALRIQRVMERDSITEAHVKARMEHQLSQQEKDKRADYLIINDGKHSLIEQALKIHRELLNVE